MQAQVPYTVSIRKLVYGGYGLGHRPDGKVVLVRGAFPQETVLLQDQECHSSFNYAKLISVLSPHPQRRPPPCKYAASCGGCSFLGIPEEQALEWKLSAIYETLNLNNAEVFPASESLGYRNRIQIRSRVSAEKKLEFGYLKTGSHDLVPIQSCAIASPAINQFLAKLADISTEFKQDSKLRLHIQEFPQGITCLIHLVGPQQQPALKQFEAALAAICFWAGCRSQPTLSLEKSSGLEYLSSPGCFAQVNRDLNQTLRQELFAALNQPQKVLDLYCGSGNLTLHCAQKLPHCQFIGAEADGRSISCAIAAAKKAKLKNLKFYRRSSLAQLRQSPAVDTIILDPPRSGIKDLIPDLLSKKVPQIIYVSCAADTLARDLKLLAALYKVKTFKVFDFFPQTTHLECMVVLTLKES